MFSIKFADDWIRTTDLWYWKRPLYQLSHNHCPTFRFFNVGLVVKNCPIFYASTYDSRHRNHAFWNLSIE